MFVVWFFFEHFDLDSLHAIAKKKSLQVTKMAKVLKHSHARHTMMWQWLSIRRPPKIHWFPLALAISIGFGWGSLMLTHTQIVSLQTDPNKKWSERMTVGKQKKMPSSLQGREPRSSRICIELAFSGHSTHIKKSRTQEVKFLAVRLSPASPLHHWPYPLPLEPIQRHGKG